METTPETIDTAVLDFCRFVVPDARPAFVPVRPEPYAEHGFCPLNVRAKVAWNRGEAVVGWVIWLAPGLLLNAERHVVWRSPAGGLVDVTPKPDGERWVLFVPEPGSTWAGQTPDANVFRPLCPRPIADLIMAAKTQFNAARTRDWGHPKSVATRAAAEARIVPEGHRLMPEPAVWPTPKSGRPTPAERAQKRKQDRRDRKRRGRQ